MAAVRWPARAAAALALAPVRAAAILCRWAATAPLAIALLPVRLVLLLGHFPAPLLGRWPVPLVGRRPARRAVTTALVLAAAVICLSVRSFWPAQTARAQTGEAAARAVQTAASRPAGATTRTASPPLTGFSGVPDLAIGARLSQLRAGSRRARSPAYRNPLRHVSDLVQERVDMGADFAGTGPVYALGKAVVTNASGDNYGWPGGGWITYQLSSGPAKGMQVYLAEDVRPTVLAGEHVSSRTVIGYMYDGGDGIETGWAMPDGMSAESQLAAAGGISGGGPFPTEVGLNFDALLHVLGVAAAPNSGAGGYGILPSFYPARWASVRLRR